MERAKYTEAQKDSTASLIELTALTNERIFGDATVDLITFN
jgi:hypothetical protein